jgi:Xaa-Pro dipeptidase
VPIPLELAFEVGEYRDRLAKVHAAMAGRELDGLLLFGPHNIYYLSGMDSETVYPDQALVVPQGREPVLVLSMLEAGRAANSCWLADVETYPQAGAREHGPPARPWLAEGPATLADAVLATVRRLGLGRGRLGMERPGGWLDPSIEARLTAGLPEARLSDPFGVIEGVRLTKSPAELRYIRRAADLSQRGVDAGTAAIREGARDTDVGAAITSAIYAAGSELACWGPIVASGYRASAPHSTWNGRLIGRGETVFLELTGQARRYIAPLMRTVVLGEPGAQIRAIADAVEGALAAIIGTARPGVPASDVAGAAIAALDPALGDAYFHGGVGYPVGIGYPVGWGESLGFFLRLDNPAPLQAGMVFHLPISVRRFGEFGVCLSQTIAIGANGSEPLASSRAVLTVLPAD